LKNKFLSLLQFIYDNFAPLIIFYGINHFWGLKPAIIVSTLFSFFDIVLKLYLRQPITGIFKFTATITLIFGVIDLYAQQSFLFKYEASVSNIFTAMFFAYSLIANKSILQEFYEKRSDAKAMTSELAIYFRLLTSVWVIYFLLKATAYFWIARNYSLEQGLLIRTILGSGSFYVMLFVSILGSKKIFPFLLKTGIISVREVDPKKI
jgi:intracellular septation protein A